MAESLKRRLNVLERKLASADDELRGFLDLPYGHDPTELLKGRLPGLYLLICTRTEKGTLGRVRSDGSSKIYSDSVQ